jgi:hypothetical protein
MEGPSNAVVPVGSVASILETFPVLKSCIAVSIPAAREDLKQHRADSPTPDSACR